MKMESQRKKKQQKTMYHFLHDERCVEWQSILMNGWRRLAFDQDREKQTVLYEQLTYHLYSYGEKKTKIKKMINYFSH
jgi:hypothetical protein